MIPLNLNEKRKNMIASHSFLKDIILIIIHFIMKKDTKYTLLHMLYFTILNLYQ